MAATHVKSTNKTKYDLGASGTNYIPSGEYGGTVKAFIDTYTTAAIETGSTITFAPLPKGAKILSVVVTHSGMGSPATLKIGDAHDDDRYYAATLATAAGTISSALSTGIGYEIGTNAGDTQIVIATAGATLTASRVIKLVVLYV